MSALLAHWPHIVPALAAFATVIYLWVADRRWRARQPDLAQSARRPGVAGARATRLALSATPRAVDREIARRGMILLGPVVAASATGAVIYGLSLATVEPSRGVLWTHAGISLLVCLLVVYKLSATERGFFGRELTAGRLLRAASSAALVLLLVPLTLTGIVLLASPSSASFAAYAHLVVSAWWTLLLVHHLLEWGSRSRRALRRPAS
jgi:hypothetical protein